MTLSLSGALAAWQFLALAILVAGAAFASVYFARKHLAAKDGHSEGADGAFWDIFAGLAVIVPAIVLAPFLSGAAMRGRPAWRGYGALSLAAGVLLVVASGWLVAGYFAGRGQWWCPVGVAQRVTLGIQYGWMVVVAGRLWVLAGRDSSAVVGTDGPSAEPAAAPDRGGM